MCWEHAYSEIFGGFVLVGFFFFLSSTLTASK